MKAKIYGFLAVVAVSVSISGCQTTASTALTADQQPAAASTKATEEPPTKPFAEGQLYELLVGEVAGVRGDFALALQQYAAQAFQSREPLVVERATKIANFSNQYELRLKLALLWSELAPDNVGARRLSAIVLAQDGRLLEALPHALFALQHEDSEPLMSIAVRAEKSGSDIRQQLLEEYNRLDKPLSNNYWISLTRAILLLNEGQLKQAIEDANKAHEINPEAESANLLVAQLYFQNGEQESAIKHLKQSIEENPDSKRLRIQYVRFLVDNDLPAAKLALDELVAQHPDDTQLAYTAANANLQLGLIDEARRSYLRLIQNPNASQQAYFQLGLLEQQQGNNAAAAQYLRQVQTGNLVVPAAARLSQLLSELDQLPVARLHLQSLRRENPDQSATLFQIESEMLIEQQLNDDAFGLLNTALETFPNDISLLYARSIAGEKIDKFSQAEADLRTILGIDQDNAMALNALGYTLTLHTNRYDEAHQLILKSLKIEPDDPATLDSLGWVLFHLGRHQEAIEQLEKAFSKMPDPEIASHLGEVYWVIGEQEKAQQLFEQMLSQNPDNALILETLQRLQGSSNPNQ